METLKKAKPLVMDMSQEYFPHLSLDRKAIKGLSDLQVEDSVELTFHATVVSVTKDNYADRIEFNLKKGELANIQKGSKSKSAVDKLKSGLQAINKIDKLR